MLEIAIRAAGRNVAPADLPALIGPRRAYRELGDMVEALIAHLDALSGDPDLEDDDQDTGIEDRPHDDEFDEEQAADHNTPFLSYGTDQSQPLPWCPADDLRARGRHRDRIRQTRCKPRASSRWDERTFEVAAPKAARFPAIL